MNRYTNLLLFSVIKSIIFNFFSDWHLIFKYCHIDLYSGKGLKLPPYLIWVTFIYQVTSVHPHYTQRTKQLASEGWPRVFFFLENVRIYLFKYLKKKKKVLEKIILSLVSTLYLSLISSLFYHIFFHLIFLMWFKKMYFTRDITHFQIKGVTFSTSRGG